MAKCELAVIGGKMNRLLIILTITFVFGCSDNERIEVIEKYPNGDPKILKIYSDNDSAMYILKEYYSDGTLKFEGKVANEKFVVYKKAYFENGNPKEIVELADSSELDFCCPDGFYKVYYNNGKLKETHQKKNGLFEGLVIEYDSTGNKTEEIEVRNDFKNGIAKTFYSTGVLKSIKEYRNDTLVGTAYLFNEKGDSLKRYNTYYGKMDFPIKYWKEDGSSLLGQYYEDEYHKVKWVWRDSLGGLVKEEIMDTTINGTFVTPDY